MSYTTVEEANVYVGSYYVSTDDVRVSWEGLTDDDKQALLNKAYSVINSLPLRGCKSSVDQEGAFPRCGDTVVPLRVKYAEVELALALNDDELTTAVQEYKRKADYGISSYSIGNFSETLLSYAGSSVQLEYGLISTEAQRYLLPWLNGGYSIE